jgi:hypothetical protein
MTKEDIDFLGWLISGTFMAWMILMAILYGEPRHEDDTEEEERAREINQ